MGKMNSSTLVLNRSWVAVQICSVKRAINLLYQGHAKAINPEDFQAYDFNDWSEISQQMVEGAPEEFICSPSIRIKIPRVIVLMLYDKLPKRQVSFSRKNIFERDNFQCQYCGLKPPSRKVAVKWLEKHTLTFDHVIPKSKGGKTVWENIVTCCYDCNRKKGSKLLSDLNWKLKKKPTRPNWHPTFNIPLKFAPHKEWTNFLDIAYWNIELDNDNES